MKTRYDELIDQLAHVRDLEAADRVNRSTIADLHKIVDATSAERFNLRVENARLRNEHADAIEILEQRRAADADTITRLAAEVRLLRFANVFLRNTTPPARSLPIVKSVVVDYGAGVTEVFTR